MRCRTLLLCAWLIGGVPLAATSVDASTRTQPPPSGDFVPVEDAPPGEQIPALPLIASAYGFIWVVMLGYVWSIGRRLQAVERELAELESRRS